MGGEFWALDTDAEVAACNGKNVGDDCYSGSVGCGICTSESDGETTVTVCRGKDCEHGCNETTHSCKHCTTTRDCGKCYTCDGGDCAPVYCEHGCDTSTGECYGCTDDDDCPCGSKCKSHYCTEVPEACNTFGCHVATDTCHECMGGGSDTGCDGCSECKESGGSANKCARKAACEKYGSVTITDDAGNRTCKCKECESGESSDNGCTKCIGGFWEVQEGAGCDPGDGGCGACNSEGECIDKECELGCTESTHTCWECDENSVSTKDPDDVTNRCRRCDTDEHKWVKLNGQTLCGTCKDGTFTPVKGRNGCVECDAGGKATLLKNKTFDYGCSGCDAEGTYYRYGGDAREVACADDSGCFVCGSGAKCVRKVAGAEVLTSGGCSFCKATPSDYRHPDRPEGLYSFNGHCIYCDGGGTDLLDGGDGSGILDDCVECKDGVPVFHAGESCTDCYPRDGASSSCLVCAADGYADVKSCGEGETLDTEDCTCRKDCGTCEKWDSTEKKCVADTSKNGEYECGTCADGVFTGGCGPCEKCEDGKTCVADTSKDGTSVGDECHACSGGVVKTYAGGYGCYSCDSDGNIKYADSGTACSHGIASRDCGRCDGSGTCQPYTGPGATTCYTCEAGEAVYAEEGTACGDGDCSKCNDSGYCRAPVVAAGTGVIDKCNTCEAGARKKNDDGPVECGTCADGVFTPSPEGTEEGKCYTCDGKGNKVKKDDGTPCGDCNWCVDGECTPTAEGDFDACNTCDGKGNKVPKSYGTVCSGGCGLCDADGKCVEDSSKSGKQVGDSCQVCEGGAPVSKDSICGDCRTCNSGGKCENKPDGVLDKCNTCTGGVKTANADGALKCGTCKDGTFTAAADGTAVDRCTVCKGGEPTAIYDSGSTPSVFDDCTYCDGMTLETLYGKVECIDCTSGTRQNIDEGEPCSSSASKCGVCSAGDCVDKTCPAGQELNTETCTCGECKYGYNNATNDCYECDPDSSGTSTCGTCKRCESGMCVADSSAKPECGTCSEGVFTPSKAGTVVDECNMCDGKGNKVQKADDTPCGDGTGCSKCKSGECKPANDGGTCATCRKCSGGACVADSSLNESRIGETCQACVAGSPKDYDGFCGPCEKCSGGKCVADESKNGPAATADLGETVCGTCKAGKLVKDDSACPCGTCGDDGKCHPDKSKDGLTCGECGECKDGACVGDPLLKDSPCHSGCGKCDSSGYCVADDSKDGETCGDGCSSCQDGECTVDSAKDGSACSSDGSGCGICSGGECTTDDEKSGQECNGGCGTCKGTACSVTEGKEGEACGTSGCTACHNGFCEADRSKDDAACGDGGCGKCSSGDCVADGSKAGADCGTGGCGKCSGLECKPVGDDTECNGGCGKCKGTACQPDDKKTVCKDGCGMCEDGDCVPDPRMKGLVCGDGVCGVCSDAGECKPNPEYQDDICGIAEGDGQCGKCSGIRCVADETKNDKECNGGCGKCTGGKCTEAKAMKGQPCGDKSGCSKCADGKCGADLSRAGKECNDGCGTCSSGACTKIKEKDGKKIDACNSCKDGKKVQAADGKLTGENACGSCKDGKFTPRRADCSAHGTCYTCSDEGECQCPDDLTTCKDASGKCVCTGGKSTECGCGTVGRNAAGSCYCYCDGSCSVTTKTPLGSVTVEGTCEASESTGSMGGCKCTTSGEDEDEDEDEDPCEGKSRDCGDCGTFDTTTCKCDCGKDKACVADGDKCRKITSNPCLGHDCGECGKGVPNDNGTGCKCDCGGGRCQPDGNGKCKRMDGCLNDDECTPQHCKRESDNQPGKCVDCTADEHCSKCGGVCDKVRGTCKPSACASGEKCDPDKGCYVCRRNSDCGSGLVCMSTADGKGKCVQCTDGDLSKCKSKCDKCSTAHVCVSDCKDGETCDEYIGTCYDPECDGKADGTACGAVDECKHCQSSRCVSKCKGDEVCRDVNGQWGCRAGCTEDSECKAKGTECATCDTETGECKECSDGMVCANLGSKYVCSACRGDTECQAGGRECMTCWVDDDGIGDCLPSDELCKSKGESFKCGDDGKCRECDSNSRCESLYPDTPMRSKCHDGVCGPCTESDCDNGLVCNARLGCVQCNVKSDCKHLSPCHDCNTETGECYDSCEADGKHCLSNMESNTGECVDCTSNAHCTGSCEECRSDLGWTCTDRCPALGKVCRGSDNECVNCTNSLQCSTARCEKCDTDIGECVEECSEQGLVCGGTAKGCVECTTHGDCDSGACLDNKCVQCSDDVPCEDGCEYCAGGTCKPYECPAGLFCKVIANAPECVECSGTDDCVAKGMSKSCAFCNSIGRCESNCPAGSDCIQSGCTECNGPGDCNGDPCDPVTHRCLHRECREDRHCKTCQECKDGACVPKTCAHGCNPGTGFCNCAKRRSCGCGTFDPKTCKCACSGYNPATGQVCLAAGVTCTWSMVTYNDDYWDDGRGGWDGPTEDIV